VRHDSPDASPPRRKVRHDSPDASPPRRKGRQDSPDASPPRRQRDDKVKAPEKKALHGLTTAAQLKAEIENKKMLEAAKLRLANPETLGQGAETVYRDRKGRRLEMLEQMEAQEKGIKQDKINYEWGRGEVQKEEEEERKRREEEEKHSSFARHSDDAQMNAWMKEASRWGDPMAGMAKVGGKKKKVYEGFCPPNRYGIRPGYRWDGVDRSNGFEATIFRTRNEQDLAAQEHYKWSSADM